jgi:hypothetical protein
VSIPPTRSLANVLRQELRYAAGAGLRLATAEVVGVTDAKHVQIIYEGEQLNVPRVGAYNAPQPGEVVYLLVGHSIMLALGGTTPMPSVTREVFHREAVGQDAGNVVPVLYGAVMCDAAGTPLELNVVTTRACTYRVFGIVTLYTENAARQEMEIAPLIVDGPQAPSGMITSTAAESWKQLPIEAIFSLGVGTYQIRLIFAWATGVTDWRYSTSAALLSITGYAID